MIILTTHGGLGNQLFQLLYGLALSSKTQEKLVVVHNARYQHRFGLSPKFEHIQKGGQLSYLLSSCRLPKLLSRLSRTRIEKMRVGNWYILDGYFQSVEDLQEFSEIDLVTALSYLLNVYISAEDATAGHLVHLRVHDHSSDIDAFGMFEAQLADLSSDTSLICNRDESLARFLSGRDPNEVPIHIRTDALSPDELLMLIMKYKKVTGPDSTLAAWASILSGNEYSIDKKTLGRVVAFLRDKVSMLRRQG